MSEPTTATHHALQSMSSRFRVPEHVAVRDFGDDSIMLNLRSGLYFGLNRIAAEAVGLWSSSLTLSESVASLAGDYGVPPDVIERDLRALSAALIDRGLLEPGPAHS